jgi:hypothetical protein
MQDRTKGWVYVITNKSIKGLCKIGFSTKDPIQRAREFDGTGTPHPYEVAWEIIVSNPRKVESEAHEILRSKNEKKEWFKCTVDEGVAAIRQASKSTTVWAEFPGMTFSKESEIDFDNPPPACQIISGEIALVIHNNLITNTWSPYLQRAIDLEHEEALACISDNILWSSGISGSPDYSLLSPFQQKLTDKEVIAFAIDVQEILRRKYLSRADKGEIEYMEKLLSSYALNVYRETADNRSIWHWAKKLIALNRGYGAHVLGLQYAKGWSLNCNTQDQIPDPEPSAEKCIYWLKKGASLGNAQCLENLAGIFSQFGPFILIHDTLKNIKYFDLDQASFYASEACKINPRFSNSEVNSRINQLLENESNSD